MLEFLTTTAVGFYEKSIFFIFVLWSAKQPLKFKKEMLYLAIYIILGDVFLEKSINYVVIRSILQTVMPIIFFYLIYRWFCPQTRYKVLFAFISFFLINLVGFTSLTLLDKIVGNGYFNPTEYEVRIDRQFYFFTTALAILWVLKKPYAAFLEVLSSVLTKLSKNSMFRVYLFILANMAIMVICAVVYFGGATSEIRGMAISFMFLNFGTVALLMFWVIRGLKIRDSEITLKSQNEMNKAYETVIQDVKGFWHSYANIIQVINVMVSTDYLELSDVKDALREFASDSMDDEISTKIAILQIPHTVIACILSSKLSYAEKLNVKLRINCLNKETTGVNWRMKDVTEVLGILLDNAIEAAHYADRNVDVRIDFTAERFDFVVENQYVIELSNDDDMKSIKKYGTSNCIGLGRVQTFVKRNKNLRYQTQVSDSNYKAMFSVLN